eukprot:49779-Prymnesium_polylepis.2
MAQGPHDTGRREQEQRRETTAATTSGAAMEIAMRGPRLTGIRDAKQTRNAPRQARNDVQKRTRLSSQNPVRAHATQRTRSASVTVTCEW